MLGPKPNFSQAAKLYSLSIPRIRSDRHLGNPYLAEESSPAPQVLQFFLVYSTYEGFIPIGYEDTGIMEDFHLAICQRQK